MERAKVIYRAATDKEHGRTGEGQDWSGMQVAEFTSFSNIYKAVVEDLDAGRLTQAQVDEAARACRDSKGASRLFWQEIKELREGRVGVLVSEARKSEKEAARVKEEQRRNHWWNFISGERTEAFKAAWEAAPEPFRKATEAKAVEDRIAMSHQSEAVAKVAAMAAEGKPLLQSMPGFYQYKLAVSGACETWAQASRRGEAWALSLAKDHGVATPSEFRAAVQNREKWLVDIYEEKKWPWPVITPQPSLG